MTAKKGDQWNITEPHGVSSKFYRGNPPPLPHLPHHAVNNYRFSSESALKRCSCSFTNADFDSHIVEDKIF